MLSRADLETFRGQNKKLTAAASRDLASFWAKLDLADPEAARDALLEFVPRLVGQYGDLAAAMAADLYDDLRAASRVPRRFNATMAKNVPDDIIRQRVRFGVQHLWTGNPEQSLKFIDGAASKYILQPARDTIALSSRRDPAKPGWARVPEPDACDFCLMLASRGFEYGSEDSAGGEYHDNCQCVAVPSWGNEPIPGYDPDALYQDYLDKRNA